MLDCFESSSSEGSRGNECESGRHVELCHPPVGIGDQGSPIRWNAAHGSWHEGNTGNIGRQHIHKQRIVCVLVRNENNFMHRSKGQFSLELLSILR